MSRPRSLKPAYCLHNSSGRAFVKLDGHRVYLGPRETQESRDAYDRTIGEWIASGRQAAPVPAAEGAAPTARIVTEVIDAFWAYVQTYYAAPADGATGGEVEHFRSLMKLLKRLYGDTPADTFGPLKLEVLMGHMVKLGWSRKYVNAQANRLKRMFKWAVSKELVPPGAHQALAAVSGLRKGKSEARETPKVRPVAQELVDSVKPHVSRQNRSQRHGGGHFYEWLTAVLLYEATGYLSLIEKYGAKALPLKLPVWEKLAPAPVRALAEDTGGPDLFAYAPDHSDWFFCEAKGGPDRLSKAQHRCFRRLYEASGKKVCVVRLKELK